MGSVSEAVRSAERKSGLPPRSVPAECDFRRRIEEELPYLSRVARHWQREKAGAEDLVQDTVVRALAHAHLFAADSNLRAWLLAIMRNVLLATAASSARWVAVGDDNAVADRDGALHPSEGRLVLRDVEEALRRLPQMQREVILAVGLDGKSYDEVARELGTSVAAVRCHLARARSRLRTAVEGDDSHWFGARLERSPAPASAPISAHLRADAPVDALSDALADALVDAE